MGIDGFRVDLKKNINSRHFDSLADMVAWCYCHYKRTLEQQGIDEHEFLGTYYDLPEDERESENYENLILLIRLQAKLIDIYTDPDSVFDWNQAVLEELEGVTLKPYKNSVLQEETFACVIITAFDFSLSPEHDTMERGWYKERIMGMARRHPMNTVNTDQVRIFPHFIKPMHQDAKTDLNFPDRSIRGRKISNQLKHVFFLEEKTISNKHRINIVQMSLPEGHPFLTNKRDWLRVAISPLTNAPVTHFNKGGEGSCYVVSHDEEYDKVYSGKVKQILEQSIKQDAHVVIFPEYMITDHIAQDIQEYLGQRSRTASELLLVVAGSQWCTEKDCDNRVHTNNVTFVFWYTGQYLGRTYKSSEFASYVTGDTISGSRRYYTERLSDPGKEILILDIEKVGRFAFPICRDVCDDDQSLTKSIVDKFRPDFLFVPAWSASIFGGFESKFIDYATRGTISVLCNCCEPIDNHPTIKNHKEQRQTLREERVMVGFPVKAKKEGRHNIRGKTVTEKCPKVVSGDVCEPGACIYIVDIHPSSENLQNGSVCENWTHLNFQGNLITE